MQSQVTKEFSNFKWPKIKNENACVSIGKQKKFALNPTQEFLGQYFTPKNPNGMLLYHSVGSGKTLTAVNLVKKFQEKGFNAIWVTRGTLKKDIDKALTLLPVKHSFPVFSYKQLSNICKRKGENYTLLINKARKISPNTNDPFYKTLIIVDEAHKLYTKDLKPQEMHDIKIIEKTIKESYNISKDARCRLVLMTGTPVTEDPMEAISLLNLLITDPKSIIKLDDILPNITNDFFKKTDGVISYIDTSKDSSKFAQVKYTEVFVEMSKENQEKSLKNCTEVFKICTKNGFSAFDCKKAKDKCLFQNKVLKDSKGKSQESLLKKKCNISKI
jgi:hypothetical protein